jgi:hypothetical protein
MADFLETLDPGAEVPISQTFQLSSEYLILCVAFVNVRSVIHTFRITNLLCKCQVLQYHILRAI